MSLNRSEKIEPNPAILYGPKTGLPQSLGSLYALPADDDTGKSKNKTLKNNDFSEYSSIGSEDGSKAGAAIAEVQTGPSEAIPTNFDPNVLPAGYGAAIIAAFLAMIEYLNQMQQQSYQAMTMSANAMIGQKDQPGLIQTWVDEGIQSAKDAGQQLMDQAIGALIGAAFAAFSFAATTGGFLKNSTDGIGSGALQTQKGAVNEQLTNAQNYKTMLSETKDSVEYEAAKPIDRLVDDQGEYLVDKVGGQDESLKFASAQGKKNLMEGVGIDKYKGSVDGNISDADLEMKTNAKLLLEDERAEAVKKADERIKNLENRLNSFDTKQQIWTQFLNQLAQGGASSGQAYGGIEASTSMTNSGKEKAQADILQQAGQTTEKNKEDAMSKAHSNQESMAQIAQAMAQALQAQVQSRA